MIIWINGTYGIGKSSVAERLKEMLKDKSEIIEADLYFEIFCKEKFIKVGGGCYPQNNKFFINDLRKIIEDKEKNNNIVIVPMTVAMEESKVGLIKYFSKKSMLKHFILTADKSIIKDRINNDYGRVKETGLNWMDNNIDFLNSNFEDAYFINTNNKTIEEIANKIYAEIN